MSGELIQLDEWRPHVVVVCTCGDPHVVPVLYFERYAAGDVDPLPECVMRAIVADWLDGL